MEQMEVQKNENLENKGDIQTQLQEQYLNRLDDLEEGQLVDGTVVQITPEQVFVDVGYKSEGRIPVSEFTELPKVGDVVSVVLVTKENRNGEVIVRQTGSTKIAGPGTYLSRNYTIHAAKDGVVCFVKTKKSHFSGKSVPRVRVEVR